MRTGLTKVLWVAVLPGPRGTSPKRRVGGGFAALLIAVGLSLLLSAPGEAQRPDAPAAAADTIQQFRLHDGTTIHGRIVAETADEVTISTVGGVTITVARADISSVRVVSGQVMDGRLVPADPNRTRLLFAPSARPLGAGEGYISSYMLFFPFVGYGITDRFSIAGGTPIFPDIIGEVFYLAPKLTVVSRPNVDLAVGALGLLLSRNLDEGSAGILYGVGTFGETDRAATLGAGWGFSLGGGESRVGGDPVLLAGGELAMTERTKLLTENWFALGGGGADGVVTGGVRFFGERLSADLGVGVGMQSSRVYCCLPLVNFVYHFPRE